MAKFRYSLQSILDIKMKMETQAKQEFAEAKNALDEENAKLNALVQRKAQYEEESRRLLMGTLKVKDIEDNKFALLRMEEYLYLQQQQVAMAEKNMNEAREHLADVMKERKTHEALREKAFEDFLQEENKAESKSVDELTSYTYGQKRQVKN